MARPRGSIGRNRTLAVLLLAGAGLIGWLITRDQETDPSSKTSRHEPIGKQPDFRNSRLSSGSAVDPTLGSAASIRSSLPEMVLTHLETFDEEEAAALRASAVNATDKETFSQLITWYQQPSSAGFSLRILDLLSDLTNPGALDQAMDLVASSSRQTDDPLVIACATSLARHGGEAGAHAILQRLNEIAMDEPEEIPAQALPLMHCLSLITTPSMERRLTQAALGEWTATSIPSRAAAIDALRSYSTNHTSAVLATMSERDPDPLLRIRALDVLGMLRSVNEP